MSGCVKWKEVEKLARLSKLVRLSELSKKLRDERKLREGGKQGLRLEVWEREVKKVEGLFWAREKEEEGKGVLLVKIPQLEIKCSLSK